jgi:hypothetical protein
MTILLLAFSLRLFWRRDRLDDAEGIEPGALRSKRSVPARGRVEDEEADLVLGNVD